MQPLARILVVDDEPGMRLSLGELLRDEHYDVDCVSDAAEADRLMESKNYDIVISDIILPQKSGLELLEHIRTSHPDTKVILITGQPNLHTAREAVRLGAFDYLSKPVTLDDLLKVVESARRLQRLEKEHHRLEGENRDYRKQLEILLDQRTKALLESEEKYLELFRQMPHGVLVLKIELHEAENGLRLFIMETNDSFLQMAGHDRDEMIGQPVDEMMVKCEPETHRWSGFFLDTAQTGRPSFFVHSCKRLNRTYHAVVYRPNPRRLIAIFDDISAMSDFP
jgi:DNA-binding response OmpR family regulator